MRTLEQAAALKAERTKAEKTPAKKCSLKKMGMMKRLAMRNCHTNNVLEAYRREWREWNEKFEQLKNMLEILPVNKQKKLINAAKAKSIYSEIPCKTMACTFIFKVVYR